MSGTEAVDPSRRSHTSTRRPRAGASRDALGRRTASGSAGANIRCNIRIVPIATARWPPLGPGRGTSFSPCPRRPRTVDIHCVTKWSKHDADWRGVSLHTLCNTSTRRPKLELAPRLPVLLDVGLVEPQGVAARRTHRSVRDQPVHLLAAERGPPDPRCGFPAAASDPLGANFPRRRLEPMTGYQHAGAGAKAHDANPSPSPPRGGRGRSASRQMTRCSAEFPGSASPVSGHSRCRRRSRASRRRDNGLFPPEESASGRPAHVGLPGDGYDLNIESARRLSLRKAPDRRFDSSHDARPSCR